MARLEAEQLPRLGQVEHGFVAWQLASQFDTRIGGLHQRLGFALSRFHQVDPVI